MGVEAIETAGRATEVEAPSASVTVRETARVPAVRGV